MRHFIKRISLILIILLAAVIVAACGAQTSNEDIAPDEAEAQKAPEATPTTVSAPAATPTALPMEVIEPVSPIAPVSPVEEPAVVQDSDVKPIPGSEAALAAVMADLSEQTGLSDSEIVLASMEAVDWSDSSLGCPQEGFMCAQVITPGYLLLFKAQGQEYEYHTDQAANVVLCE